MMNFKSVKKILSFLLATILLLSVIPTFPVYADDTEITEISTYVLDRDANGDHLYRYQSPCMIGYDMDNKYGGNGVPIQAFVYTMYNSITGEYFPTYCADINVTANQGSDYRRLNLEDASFASNAGGRIRAILEKGFYIIPIDGESDDAHAARVTSKVAEIAEAAGLDSLTAGEAIAATQTAIWQIIHGPILSFPKFCRYVFNPTNTKYGSLCSYNELRYKNNTLINETIQVVYDYLLSLDPVAPTETTVSPASFVDLQDPVLTLNEDGTYDVSVTTCVDVDMVSGDSLTLKAKLNDTYSAQTALAAGTQVVTLTMSNVPASVATGEVKLSISGYQTAEGYFLFDAVGGRTASQTMVGYNKSRLPVYAEVVATEDRILNIHKTTGSGSSRTPLSNIIFDIFPVATMEEYTSGAVVLPDATEYDYPKYPEITDYVLVTDENGKASMNFNHYGLPDGVYLVVERNHPSIVAPIEPFYLFVPTYDNENSEYIYDITIKPKNDVKGGVKIEKDVISVGNDEATVDAYTSHTWIIGTTIPEDISSAISYVITDTLDNRLDYVGNVKVNLETVDGTVEAVTLSADTDYTLTVTDVDSLSDGNPSDAFEIQLTGNGINKIVTAIGTNSFSNYILRTYFDAQINANAQMGTQIPNQAAIEYVNAANFKFTAASDKPYVAVGGANLLKVDAKDNQKTLSGAVFEVYRTATEDEVAAGGDNLVEIADVVGKVVKVSFFDNAALEGEKVTSVTSDENGNVVIYGLAYGKYYLVETKAPAGYNLLGNTQDLTIDATSHMAEKVITVKNKSGTVLPSTGGIGTTIFTVSGITLMCVACLFLLMNKRKADET